MATSRPVVGCGGFPDGGHAAFTDERLNNVTGDRGGKGGGNSIQVRPPLGTGLSEGGKPHVATAQQPHAFPHQGGWLFEEISRALRDAQPIGNLAALPVGQLHPRHARGPLIYWQLQQLVHHVKQIDVALLPHDGPLPFQLHLSRAGRDIFLRNSFEGRRIEGNQLKMREFEGHAQTRNPQSSILKLPSPARKLFWTARHPSAQKHLRRLPITLNRFLGNVQDVGNLGIGHVAEIPSMTTSCRRVDLLQLRQCRIQPLPNPRCRPAPARGRREP